MAETSEVISGVVEGVTTFGAFVKLEDGRKGLVHISEIARGYVKDINDHLAVGDEVTVKILGQDENGRLRLSIRQALPPEPPRQSKTEFEDTLNRFLKQSEERQLDVKRNIRKKSGGKGRR